MHDLLIELGFSKNAATVYLALLELGVSTITKITELTKLHPQIVYNALDELQKYELASFATERGRRYFQPGPPATLLELQKNRLMRVEDILPQLLTRYQKSEQPMVFVYSGDTEFRKARDKVIKSIPRGGCYYVIGSGGNRFLQAMGGTFRDTEEDRIQRGVKKKVIDFKDTNEYEDPHPHQEARTEYRYLNFEGGPTSTLFGGEYLRINIWTQPVITILIKNAVLVESYKKYFDLLWHQGSTEPWVQQSKTSRSHAQGK